MVKRLRSAVGPIPAHLVLLIEPPDERIRVLRVIRQPVDKSAELMTLLTARVRGMPGAW
jgi:hypothetical protein